MSVMFLLVALVPLAEHKALWGPGPRKAVVVTPKGPGLSGSGDEIPE